MKYRKKPVVVEAVQFSVPDPGGFINDLEALKDARKRRDYVIDALGVGKEDLWLLTKHGYKLQMKTLEGYMIAKPGDWIIKGVEGELYPCKDSIFKKTYEEYKPQESVVADIY